MNTQVIWTMFMKILKNTNISIFLMIWLLICLLIKKPILIVTELFFREWKLNIYLAFITQSYFIFLKNIILKSTHYFVIKIPSKRKSQHIAFNGSSDIDFKNLMNHYKKYTAHSYSFLMIDATLASENPSRFINNLVERI